MQHSIYVTHHCHGCKHFEAGLYDNDTGYSDRDSCEYVGKLYVDGECTEQVAIVLEGILFKLSELNNCPFYQEPRRSLTEPNKQA